MLHGHGKDFYSSGALSRELAGAQGFGEQLIFRQPLLPNAIAALAFFAYADNYLIDVRFGIILDVQASRTLRTAEVGAAKTMLERTDACFGLNCKAQRVAMSAQGTEPRSEAGSSMSAIRSYPDQRGKNCNRCL